MNRIGRVLIVLCALASLGIVALISLRLVARESDPALHAGTTSPDPQHDPPVLGSVPEFNLTERSGKPITSQELAGKVWIADFVFTHCAGPCPMMTQRMSTLQHDLQPRPEWNDIRLTSFSVDPRRDTPEVLRDYAKQFAADETHWLFITGPEPTIRGLTRDGFKLPVGDDENNAVMHSTRFVLVDRELRIRGYYEGLENEGMDKLKRDLDRVLAEK